MIEAAEAAGLLAPEPGEIEQSSPTPSLVAKTSTAQEPLAVMDFLSLKSLSDALLNSQWSTNEEVAVYVNIARDPALSAKERIIAMRELRNIIFKTAQLRGLIRDATFRQGPEGTAIEVTGRGVVPPTDALTHDISATAEIVDEIPKLLENKYVEDAEGEITEIRGGLSRRPIDSARRFNPRAIGDAALGDPTGDAADDEGGDGVGPGECAGPSESVQEAPVP